MRRTFHLVAMKTESAVTNPRPRMVSLLSSVPSPAFGAASGPVVQKMFSSSRALGRYFGQLTQYTVLRPLRIIFSPTTPSSVSAPSNSAVEMRLISMPLPAS